MMARAFLLAALLAVAAAPVVRAAPAVDNPDTIPMNAKGKYAKADGPDTSKECARIFGCVECEYVAKPTGTKHRSEGAFLQCLACDLAQGYVLNTFTGRCDCAGGYGAPMASGQLTSLWKYVPEYVDTAWNQEVEDGSTKPILLPDFIWPGKYRYCTLCPAGTYTDGPNPIRTRCSFCPRGTTTEGAGCSGTADQCCTQCAPGWRWNAAANPPACAICAAGTWSPGGPKDASTICEACDPPANAIGIAAFTLNAGAGSPDQCKLYPVCPGATADATCPDSNYIIRKGFHLVRDVDGEEVNVPTTQAYQKKTGDGVEGYYCVACPEGTTTTNCQTVGGVCQPNFETTTNPTYKKLKETHFKRGYHGDFPEEIDVDDPLPGVDPIEGYKKVKYTFKEDVEDTYVPV